MTAKTANPSANNPDAADTLDESARLNAWPYIWGLIRFSPWLFIGVALLRALIFGVSQQATALVTQRFFDALGGKADLANPMTYVGLIIAIALARVVTIFADITLEIRMVARSRTLVARNMFNRILQHPGAQAVPGSPGEAVSRFRGDLDQFVRFVDRITFLSGRTVLAVLLLTPIVTLLASWLPAMVAAQQDPAAILSEE